MKKILIFITMTGIMFYMFFAACNQPIYEEKSTVKTVKHPDEIIKPFPIFENDTVWQLQNNELKLNPAKQYPMPPVEGSKSKESDMTIAALITNILDNSVDLIKPYLNQRIAANNRFANEYASNKSDIVSYIIDDIMGYNQRYPYQTNRHSEIRTRTVYIFVPIFFIPVPIPIQENYVYVWYTYTALTNSPYWDIVDNSVKYELFLNKYYYTDPAIGITLPVEAQITNTNFDAYTSGSNSNYVQYLMNNIRIKLKFKMPQYVLPNNIPLPGNYTHDMGYISPVVVNLSTAQSPKYIMWCTKLQKIYVDNPEISINKCYRAFYYKYTPACFKSTDGNNWQAAEAQYLNGFNETEQEAGGRMIIDIKKAPNQNRWNIYYIARDTTSDNDLNWNMYMAYSVSTEPIDWYRSAGGSLFCVLDRTQSGFGFDAQSVGKGSVICESGNSYKMWYAGINGLKRQIGYATSTSGLENWQRMLAGEPVLKRTVDRFDSVYVADPSVIHEETPDGTVYKMFYSGYDGEKWRLGLAYSWDGQKFQYCNTGHTPLDISDYARYPYVLKEDNGTYKIWYCSREKITTTYTYDDPNDNYLWVIKMADNTTL